MERLPLGGAFVFLQVQKKFPLKGLVVHRFVFPIMYLYVIKSCSFWFKILFLHCICFFKCILIYYLHDLWGRLLYMCQHLEKEKHSSQVWYLQNIDVCHKQHAFCGSQCRVKCFVGTEQNRTVEAFVSVMCTAALCFQNNEVK